HGLVVPFGEGGAPGLAHPGDHRDGGDTVRANPTAPTAQDGDAPASVAACLPGARAGQPGERFLTCPRHAFRDDAAAGPSGGVVTLRYRQMAGTRRRRVPRLVPRTLIMVERGNEFTFLAVTLEPPIGIEPMTYALREARFRALGARPALMHCPGRSECPERPEITGIRSTTCSTTPGRSQLRCVISYSEGRR